MSARIGFTTRRGTRAHELVEVVTIEDAPVGLAFIASDANCGRDAIRFVPFDGQPKAVADLEGVYEGDGDFSWSETSANALLANAIAGLDL